MYKVYGDIYSGNCYKIKLLMSFLDIPHEWQHVNILKEETQSNEFKSINPNAKIPVLEVDEHVYLSESNAILNFLAEGSDLLPGTGIERARVLQWQFFEQYSHEPYIAVARYINKYLGLPEERKDEYHAKQFGGHKALSVMEEQLSKFKYLIGDQLTIADISLYAYTQVAHEGGFSLDKYPWIQRWLKSIEAQPGYLDMSYENS